MKTPPEKARLLWNNYNFTLDYHYVAGIRSILMGVIFIDIKRIISWKSILLNPPSPKIGWYWACASFAYYVWEITLHSRGFTTFFASHMIRNHQTWKRFFSQLQRMKWRTYRTKRESDSKDRKNCCSFEWWYWRQTLTKVETWCYVGWILRTLTLDTDSEDAIAFWGQVMNTA